MLTAAQRKTAQARGPFAQVVDSLGAPADAPAPPTRPAALLDADQLLLARRLVARGCTWDQLAPVVEVQGRPAAARVFGQAIHQALQPARAAAAVARAALVLQRHRDEADRQAAHQALQARRSAELQRLRDQAVARQAVLHQAHMAKLEADGQLEPGCAYLMPSEPAPDLPPVPDLVPVPFELPAILEPLIDLSTMAKLRRDPTQAAIVRDLAGLLTPPRGGRAAENAEAVERLMDRFKHLWKILGEKRKAAKQAESEFPGLLSVSRIERRSRS